MSPRSFWSVLPCAFLLVACGSDGNTDNQSGQGGALASGGSAGKSASGGSGGSSAGSGGAAGNSAGGAGGLAEPDCRTLGPGAIAGELDGQPIMESWEIQSVAPVAADPWLSITEFSNRGFDLYRGAEMANPSQLGSGDHAVQNGVLWSPTSGSLAGQVVCFGSGTATQTAPPVIELRSTKAKLLGSCPGEPVTGELTLCQQGGVGCPDGSSGMVDGQSLDSTALSLYTSSVDPENPSFSGRGEKLAVVSYVSGELTSGTSGMLDQAILITFPENTDGGAVYCAGEGSTYDLTTAEYTGRLVLKNLSKLGGCGSEPGSDSLLVCR